MKEWHDVKGFHGPTIDEECMATKLKNRMYGMTWVMSFPLSSIVSMTHCNMSSYQSDSAKFHCIAYHCVTYRFRRPIRAVRTHIVQAILNYWAEEF